MKAGLVSVTFRKLQVEEIVSLCAEAGLAGIEWGGDIHVPPGDLKAAEAAGRATRAAGLEVACYGSYVRMTDGERELLPKLVDTAQALGAPMIRVWAGKGEDADMGEIVRNTRALCDMAEDLLVTFEFHGGTLTHSGASARLLMEAVDRPNARCQWQPPVDLPEGDCLSSIENIRPWLGNIHVFSWDGTLRLPLEARAESWKKYFRKLSGDRFALLEFVRGDDPAQFSEDAAELLRLIKEA